MFINSLTSRSKQQQRETKEKEALLKEFHAELQYLKRKGQEKGQRDAQEYAELQKEDTELDAEVATLE